MTVEFVGLKNLFESDCDVLTNAVNCVGVMGGGIALEFKTRYPEMNRDYVNHCNAGLLKPGILHFWVGENKPIILNFPTKDHWRDPSKYEYIWKGLAALQDWAEFHPGLTVAIPMLGCGLGGLNWDVVAKVIPSYLELRKTHFVIFGDDPSSKRTPCGFCGTPVAIDEMHACSR